MLTLQLPARVEELLSREAQARGIGVSDLAASLLAAAVIREPESTIALHASPLLIRSWLDSLTAWSDSIPEIPAQNFDRAMIYQDHD